MKSGPFLGGILLLALGCHPRATRPPVYAAWEEGLTLGFEAPDPASPKGESARFQKQVVRTVWEGETRRVEVVYTTVNGRLSMQQVLRRGGVAFVDGQGRRQVLLPEGFPDAASAWDTSAHHFTVLGRARWERPQPLLPDAESREGIWVEANPLKPGGTRIRAFYLPGIGEAEAREWRDGRWVTTNLLVSRGFTEIPRVRDGK